VEQYVHSPMRLHNVVLVDRSGKLTYVRYDFLTSSGIFFKVALRRYLILLFFYSVDK
jgi:hypothetical protein